MKFHVLPGDALATDFRKTNIEGEVIVCRECLVEGNVKAENLENFWQIRAEFIEKSHGESQKKYFQNVVGEFEKLTNITSFESEINLWFEYELFCQVNLWFCLSLLRETASKIYRVAPVVRKEKDIWKGFGSLEANDLERCFAKRIEFSEKDILLGTNLWKAYQNADYEMLEKLPETESECFPHLREVCRAEIEKDSQPQNILREISAKGAKDFTEIFSEFTNLAGVYGYGDAQVRRILQEINPQPMR